MASNALQLALRRKVAEIEAQVRRAVPHGATAVRRTVHGSEAMVVDGLELLHDGMSWPAYEMNHL